MTRRQRVSQHPGTMTKSTSSKHNRKKPEVQFRRRDPVRNTRSLFLEGQLFQKKRKYSEALNAFQSLLSQNPAHIPSLLRSSRIYETMADQSKVVSQSQLYYKKALSFLETAYNFQNQKEETQDSSKHDLLGVLKYHQGKILAKQGDYETAGTALDHALYNAPLLLEAWDARGLVFTHLEQMKDAQNCFSAALSINDSHIPAILYGHLLETESPSSLDCSEHFLATFFPESQRTLQILHHGIPTPTKGLSATRSAQLSEQLQTLSKTYSLQAPYEKAVSSLITWLQNPLGSTSQTL